MKPATTPMIPRIRAAIPRPFRGCCGNSSGSWSGKGTAEEVVGTQAEAGPGRATATVLGNQTWPGAPIRRVRKLHRAGRVLKNTEGASGRRSSPLVVVVAVRVPDPA